MSQSQISQVIWKIAEEFCPRIILIDGRIQWVSMIGPTRFIANKLWLPSRIKMISSKSFYENDFIRFVVIENQSKLEGVESEAFKKTDILYLTIPSSVVFLGEKCFSECRSLSSVTFESRSRLSRIEKEAFRNNWLG
jgi:hypothetical protein